MVSCLERETNAFLWIALISTTIFLLRQLSKVFGLWAKARPIPSPPCHSVYGHCNLISGSSLTDVLYKCHKKFGGVVKLWLGPTQLLVSVEDTQIIKEVLSKAEDKLPLTGRAFRLAFGKSSLFISSFEKVKKRRNSLEVELGGSLLHRVSLAAEQVVDQFFERDQNLEAVEGLDCENVSQHLAFTLLGATLFGDVFLSWPKATVYEELLMKIAKEACFWASYCVTPFWKKEFWRYQELCAELKCLTQELIEECSVTYKSNFLWDFGHHHDHEYEPCGEIISLMFHGCLTMASLIGNIFTRLAMHLGIQDKPNVNMVQDPLREDSEIIMGRRSELQNVDVMPHLLATLFESARLLPAGPLLQRCSLKHDLNLKNGMVIPAGAIIVVPVQLIQLNRSNWGSDADKFNPYRFLSWSRDGCKLEHQESLTGHGSCNYNVRMPNEFEAFLSFGSGARACIAPKLAVLQLSSMFAAILERFEVRLQPGSESDPKPTMSNCVLQLLPSPKIMFVKRKQ